MSNNSRIIKTKQLKKYKKVLKYTKIFNNLNKINNKQSNKKSNKQLNNAKQSKSKYIIIYSVVQNQIQDKTKLQSQSQNQPIYYINFIGKIKNKKVDTKLLIYKRINVPDKTLYKIFANIYNLTDTEANTLSNINDNNRNINPQTQITNLPQPIITKTLQVEQSQGISLGQGGLISSILTTASLFK
jgi:hypothetical protein